MKRIAAILTALFLISAIAYGQTIVDALRNGSALKTASARSSALGEAFFGLSDDFSAIAYNPAGLSLVKKDEFTLGFGYGKIKTLAVSGSSRENDDSYAYLSSVGLVMPFKTKSGRAAAAVGYYFDGSFDNLMKFSRFNTVSTYTDYEATRAKYNGWGINENFATYLWLADDYYETPLKKDLAQYGEIDESGGVHNFAGSLAFDLGEVLSVGASVTGKWGTYDYYRDFTEEDSKHIYEKFVKDSAGKFLDLDFDKLDVRESLEQNFSGVGGSIGVMGKFGNHIRLSLTLFFPDAYEFEETFSQKAAAFFDNGDAYDTTYVFGSTYSLYLPWRYAVGASINFAGLTIAGGVEISDESSLEYSDAAASLEDLNSEIRRSLGTRTKWGAGFEYDFPFLPVELRGSYNATSSPYKEGPSFDIESYAFGAGFYLAPNARLDFTVRATTVNDFWYLYGGKDEGAGLSFSKKPADFILQIVYRY